MNRAIIGNARPIINVEFYCHMHQAKPNDGGQIKIINQLTFNLNGHWGWAHVWNSYASPKKSERRQYVRICHRENDVGACR